MIVPDISRASKVKQLSEEVDSALVIQNEQHYEKMNDNTLEHDHSIVKKPRGFGRGTVFPKSTSYPGRSVPYRRNSGAGLTGRQDCPVGKAYYSCANGFKGCCSSDPCNPNGSCPDDQNATINNGKGSSTDHAATALQATSITSTLIQDITVTTIPTQPPHGFDTTNNGGFTTQPTSHTTHPQSSQSSPSSSSATSTSPSPKSHGPPPPCPKANGTLFTDPSSIEYLIRCSTDSTFPISSTLPIRSGGYGKCIPPCSESPVCAGFTFISATDNPHSARGSSAAGGGRGGGAGKCYFRTALPLNEFEPAPNSRYVTCAKTNATASSTGDASHLAEDSGTSKGHAGSIGAAVGGVIGGLALVALVFGLVRLGAKRRSRNTVEELHTRSVYYGDTGVGRLPEVRDGGGYRGYQPPEMHQRQQQHVRAGSTGNDVMMSGAIGGGYDSPVSSPVRSHARQRSIYHEGRERV